MGPGTRRHRDALKDLETILGLQTDNSVTGRGGRLTPQLRSEGQPGTAVSRKKGSAFSETRQSSPLEGECAME